MGVNNSLVFFGSGPVAAQSLALLAQNFTIEAVVTKPRPPHHRGDVPVLDVAEKLGLPVHHTVNKAELSELFSHQQFTSKLGVVIDYGIIINQDVIDYFPLGIVNSHFSLLPEWRGADPITFSILSGQKQTGISLMLIVEKMDEGPLLAQAPYDLTDTITTPELTNELVELSNESLKEILPLYIAGKIQAAPQEQVSMAPSKTPSYSRKLTKEDGLIVWTKPAGQIEREIRAFIEWPKSRTQLAGKDIVVTKAHAVPSNSPSRQPGDVEVAGKVLMVTCGSGYLCIDRLKPAGKNEMTAEGFLAGHKSLL